MLTIIPALCSVLAHAYYFQSYVVILGASLLTCRTHSSPLQAMWFPTFDKVHSLQRKYESSPNTKLADSKENSKPLWPIYCRGLPSSSCSEWHLLRLSDRVYVHVWWTVFTSWVHTARPTGSIVTCDFCVCLSVSLCVCHTILSIHVVCCCHGHHN